VDAEKLAAFLDGRLDDRQRSEMVEQIASSEETLEILADVLAVTRELGDARVVDDGVGTAQLRTRRWRLPPGLLALAAAIALMVFLPLTWQALRRTRPEDPTRFASALSVDAARLPSGWDYAPWSTTRAGSEAMSPQARAVRLGARLVDLQVALRSQDTRAAVIARDITTLLEEVPMGALLAGEYRTLASGTGQPADAQDPGLTDAGRRVAEQVGSDLVGLGAWIEAARLAAAHRDLRFFQTRGSRSMLERALEQAETSGSGAAALSRNLGRAASGQDPDWVSIERDLAELLRRLGT
jgi:hypothetical protein